MRILKNKLVLLFGTIVSLAMVGMMAIIPTGEASAKTIQINASDYGYGKYKVTAKGVGYRGVYDEDSVVFYYLPIYVTDGEDDDGNKYLDFDYLADDGTEESEGEVAKIEIKIYDENGNEVDGLSPIVVYPPTDRITLDFDDYDLPSGTYRVEVTAYNKDNEALYKPYVLYIEYDRIEVPDTGNFFQVLNIAKTDYLVTGLIIFGLVAVSGIIIITRTDNHKKTTKTKKH